MSKIKFPFALKVLEQRLTLEREFLKSYNINFVDGKLIEDPSKFPDYVKSNISSCEHRIEELVECINFLKNETI